MFGKLFFFQKGHHPADCVVVDTVPSHELEKVFTDFFDRCKDENTSNNSNFSMEDTSFY